MPSRILLVTLGDPNGIGPEVAAKSVRPASRREVVVLIGSSASLDPWKRFLGRAPIRLSPADLTKTSSGTIPSGIYLIEPPGGAASWRPGRIDPEAARMGYRSFATAVDLLKKNPRDFALVTAPISKEACLRAGLRFTGHTGYLGHAFRTKPLMLLASGNLRVGLVTEHIPLAQVPDRVTPSSVLSALRLFACGLADLSVAPPKKLLISVLGLNPHAGEGGKIGREDLRIGAAVRAFNRLNLGRAVGPVPGDSAFCARRPAPHGYLAMYHDQGLIPVKMFGSHAAVNITLGLPIRRTSPAHGTAFDIAGLGVADPRSMRLAIRWALHSFER